MNITKDIEVSWGDLDALNHVNNTTYLRYMEDTRMVWFTRLGEDLGSTTSSPAVVNININFRQEIRYPSTVRVTLSISRASEKRVLNHYAIVDRDQPEVVYADAELTLVWIDRETRRSVPVPSKVRDSIDQSSTEQSFTEQSFIE
jgi:acyl-CoA thioester hydrolase